MNLARTLVLIATVAALAGASLQAQTKPPQKSAAASSAASDRLGMTCTQILELSSADWTAKFAAAKGSIPDATERGISAYGKCYDAHTDSLAAALTKKGTGPTKKTRANFAQFDAAAKAFTARALADLQPTPDQVKVAYINLYEKQFRREFYTAYEQKTVGRALTPDESEQYRKAKNRFGELLGLLTEDKGHEVHRAFGDVVGSHSVSLPMNLALYRYAIFILEPPSDKPFAPPPF